MRTKLFTFTTGVSVSFAALIIGGCAHSPTPRHYLLTPMSTDQSANKQQDAGQPIIVVRPVKIAGYLNRPQIVTRSGEREVANSQFDRWAEPLDSQIDNLLSDRLVESLKEFSIQPFPWHGERTPAYEIQVSIQYLDGVPDQSVRLKGSWLIFTGGKEKKLIADQRCLLQAECETAGIPGVVAATENLIEQLSQVIVDAVIAGGGVVEGGM